MKKKDEQSRRDDRRDDKRDDSSQTRVSRVVRCESLNKVNAIDPIQKKLEMLNILNNKTALAKFS